MTQTIAIKVPPELWATSIMPEGIIERWLLPNGSRVKAGDPVAAIRIESMLHELMAPATGILKTACEVNSVVDPGCMIGQIETHLDP